MRRVLAQIVEAEPTKQTYKLQLLRLFAQTPDHGAIRTHSTALYKAYLNWSYERRKTDKTYQRHVEKCRDGGWLLFKDVREAWKYYYAKEKPSS